MIYVYTEKEYSIFSKTKVKIDGRWIDAIIYETLYNNSDGRYWVRTEEEFYRLFKEKGE